MLVRQVEILVGLLEVLVRLRRGRLDLYLRAADADVVVINTCSVRERAEEKLYTRLGELRQLANEQGHDPIIAIAGCGAQQDSAARLKPSPGVADVAAGTHARPHVLAEAQKGASERASGRAEAFLGMLVNVTQQFVSLGRQGREQRSPAAAALNVGSVMAASRPVACPRERAGG